MGKEVLTEQKNYFVELTCTNCGSKVTITAHDSNKKDAYTNAVTIANIRQTCCVNPNYR